jgi:tetratricopeptide (TPR) repeat protein
MRSISPSKSPWLELAGVALLLGLSQGTLASDSHHAQAAAGTHGAKSEDKKNESDASSEKGDKLLRQAACENLPQKTSEDLWKVAECFRKEGDPGQAIASLREITRKDPRDLEAAFITAWLLWEDGHRRGGREEQARTREALEELKQARVNNPSHWLMDTELGDFYLLRLKAPELAYPEYVKARSHYDGDFARNVEAASVGRKTAIENRIARTSEMIGRKGEAVEASCRAMFFDPDDKEALQRIERLSGSCERKGVKDPRAAPTAKSKRDEDSI